MRPHVGPALCLPQKTLERFRHHHYHVGLALQDEKVVLLMGLVSMIFELREQGSAPEPPADGIQTKVSSAGDRSTQEAISLRTFALRLDTKKRRNQKLGR